MNEKQLNNIKSQYPAGTKIRLNMMHGEPNMPAGLKGTVVDIDGIGQIHMKWENGSSLALNIEVDDFDVIEKGTGNE